MLKKLLFISLTMFFFKVNAQVGIGTENPKATLDVVAANKTGSSTNVEGILIPRVSRERVQSMVNVEKSTLVFVDDVTSGSPDENMEQEGFYYFDGALWTDVAPKKEATPASDLSHFYMPSVVLPTISTDSRILDTANLDYTYANASGEYTVNLYSLYKIQFTTPITSSIVHVDNPSLPIGTPVTAEHTLESVVKPATSYHYFITYADPNVFEEIKLDGNGILKYKVKANSIVRTGTFMNIVIKSK